MHGIVRRSMAAGVAFALALTGAVLPIRAGAGAVLAGRVTGADGTSPRSGVVVHLVQDGLGESVASASTDERGAFRIDPAPPGSYRVLVEAPEGAFLATEPIAFRDGEAPAPVLLALRQEEPPEAPAPAEPVEPAEPKAAPPPPSAPSGLPTWAKWTIVGVVGISAAFVVNEVTDEDEASDL